MRPREGAGEAAMTAETPTASSGSCERFAGLRDRAGLCFGLSSPQARFGSEVDYWSISYSVMEAVRTGEQPFV